VSEKNVSREKALRCYHSCEKREDISALEQCWLQIRQFFDAMFAHDMEENKERMVKITDIDAIVFKEMLRFMYCKRVENIANVAQDLIIAADKYDGRIEISMRKISSSSFIRENLIGLFSLSHESTQKECSKSCASTSLRRRIKF